MPTSKDLIVIVDGKRNDIGSTAEAYARGYLGKVPIGGSFEPSWQADAITVNPYLGSDGVLPFIKVAAREQKGVFVLVRTSNTSAGEFQDLLADGKPLYRHVADRLDSGPSRIAANAATASWARSSARPTRSNSPNCGRPSPASSSSCPATAPKAASARDVAGAFDANGLGALVNNSRGITFAYERPAYHARFGDDWQAAIAQAVHDMIDDLAANTNAGRLRSDAKSRQLMRESQPNGLGRLVAVRADAASRPCLHARGASPAGRPTDHERTRSDHRERHGQHEDNAPVVAAGHTGDLTRPRQRPPPCSWDKPRPRSHTSQDQHRQEPVPKNPVPSSAHHSEPRRSVTHSTDSRSTHTLVRLCRV